MKIIAVNGSPRKGWNTETLLREALKGAEAEGAETEFVHLYELKFRGCSSCFSCKRKDNAHKGHCVVNDDLTACMDAITGSDAFILGSPVYFGNLTGGMVCLLERLLFSNHSYGADRHFTLDKKLPSGFIYTMNVPAGMYKTTHYEIVFDHYEKLLTELGGHSEYMTSMDTYQFDDYGKYETSRLDEAHKAKIREKQFPIDCEKAFEMGRKLARMAAED